MKILVMLFVLYSSTVFAESDTLVLKSKSVTQKSKYTVNVKVNPIHMAIAHYNLELEIPITEKLSASLRGALSQTKFKGTGVINNYDFNYSSFGLGLSYYFNAVARDSWYSTVAYDLFDASVDSKVLNFKGNADGGSLKYGGGYQWIWSNFNLQLGAGLASTILSGNYSYSDNQDNSVSLNLSNTTSQFYLDIILGFAF
jgi:hypothetical protein